MIPYQNLEIVRAGGVATVWMNRPERHNAFDEQLIAELSQSFTELDEDASVRVIVLAGRGASFSAGGDLNWMKRQAQSDLSANIEDARELANMLRTLYRCSKPTIARVHGAALGGGMGLVAACDIALASSEAQFGTTEVRVGLIPATIGPYVLTAMSARSARRYFQTGERFSAEEALRIGFVHETVAPEILDLRLKIVLDSLLSAGPKAQAAAKRLIVDLNGRRPDAYEVLEETARGIATIRATKEGREGIGAFLEKRKPVWN